MIRKIRKRDGKIADFNPLKITSAIWKAAQAVGGKDYKKSIELTDIAIQRLEKELPKGEIPTVEQVQDIVEKTLIEQGHARTGKAYILYRKQHQDMREIGGLLKDIDVVDDYLSMMDWKVQENSNMAYSLQGLNVYATENIISHYWLNKIYPPEIGDAHKKGAYHLHDLGTLGAYTYYGKETVIAKIDGKIILSSFQDLYEKIKLSEEILSIKDDAKAKYPKEIEVLDKDGWTKVYRVVKKAKQKQMHYIKNEGGRSVIVTEDHPMLLENGSEKEAKNIQKENDKLLTVDLKKLLSNEKLFYKEHLYIAKELYDKGIKNFWIEGMPYQDYEEYSRNLEVNGIISTSNNADALPNKIELTEKLGYLIGFYIAEGNMDPHRISIIQKNTIEKQGIIDRITDAAYEIGCRIYSKNKNDFIEIRIVNTTLVKYLLTEIFNLEGLSKEKRLPAEILTYNQDFVQGVIAGVLDGDGSINTSNTSLIIRTASRTMLEQIAQIMNILGFTVRDRNLEGVGTTRMYNGREIIQNYPLYGISFRTLESSLPSLLYQTAQISTKAWRAEGAGWHKVLNNEPTEIMDDYIYDITTETSTLVVNGMWNHNCVGWDLKDILLLGFRGVSGKIESKPAKHFGTALMQIVNYLYTLQGEAAGAQALSNFDSLLAPFIKYDGLNYKDVKQEMQKFLFNMNVPTRVGFQSLAHDEPILFRKNGKIKVEQIGKLIEENFGENRKSIINNVDGYGTTSKDSFALIPNDKYEVISFDKKGEINWHPVKALIKHRVQTNGFKRIRTGSGEIKVSPAHSLFKSNSNHIKPVMAKELECAKPNETLNGKNHILAVNKLKQNILGNKNKIDLFDLIEELPETIKKRIFIQAEDVPQIKEKIGKLYGSLKEFLYKNGRIDKTTLYDAFKNNVVPFEMYIKYSDEIRNDAKIYIKPYNENLYDRYLNQDKLKNFVQLVAWFITEGKAVHSGIVISQEKTKSDEILDVAKALGINVTINETRGYSTKTKSKTDTIISNMKMSGLYTYLLPYLAGATSKEKTVPSFIFDLNSDFRTIFLKTLFKGDGYADKTSKRITYSSMSDKLLTAISLLGITNGWRVRVFPKSKGRAGTLLIYENPKKDLDIIIEETAGVPVYEINDYKNDWDWEYDISVDIKDCEENFAGGAGLVFYHNSPFTNITLDLTIPSYMKDEPAIIGGDLKDDNYSDFVDELGMVNNAFAEVMHEGDAKGRPFTFPIPTYNITKDFDWENQGLDPIWEMTAKYGVPYFSNFINSDMKPEDARSMCCRLRLSNRELRKRGGGLFGANPKTGSIGVVTINMPQIGYLSKDDNDFFEKLDALMDLAKQSLEIKREVIENLTFSGLHPYSRFYLSDVKKTFGEYWKNHFSTIGLIGMNDALLNFMNKGVGDKEGKAFAEKVLDHMRDKMADYQQETGNLFNLEATPGEGSLAPDEKVLISQSDPRFDEIGPLVDKYLENNKEEIQMVGTSEVLKISYGEMFTWGFSRNTQKIKKYPVTALVRHPGKSMYEIVTNSGRKVRVTGQHSVFSLDPEGVPREVLVSNLDVGVPIAVPKQINIETCNEEFNLIELFKNSSVNKYLYGMFPASFVDKLIADPNVEKWCKNRYKICWKDIKYSWKKSNVIPIKLIYDLGIILDRETLLYSKIFYRYTKNTRPINIIISIDEDLGFVIGCLLSEGWLTKRSQFSNTDKGFAERFLLSVEKSFGKNAAYLSSGVREKPRKILHRVTMSKITGLFFKEIGLCGKSNDKKMPNFLFSSNLNCAAGVLRGYYLGDGSFYQNRVKNDYSVDLYSNSKDLIEGLNLLLLRFGILTKIRYDRKSKYNGNWNDNYSISITGADNLQVFFTDILREKSPFTNVHSGRYIIPGIPKLLKQMMHKHRIKPADIGICKDSFNRNVRLNRISIQYLQEIVQKLSEKIKERDETLERLKILVNSDIYWDKVKEIKKLEPTKYVYDFEVDVKDDLVNNFLGGSGLVCLHNTSYRLPRIDKAQYPDIRIYNQDKYNGGRKSNVEPYYTNSTQLPVGFTDDAFEALDLQDSLQSKYTGGTVLHMFLGEEPSANAAKKLVRKVAENYHLPYYTLTPTFSVCPKHGYIAGEHEYCPKCDEEIGYKKIVVRR